MRWPFRKKKRPPGPPSTPTPPAFRGGAPVLTSPQESVQTQRERVQNQQAIVQDLKNGWPRIRRIRQHQKMLEWITLNAMTREEADRLRRIAHVLKQVLKESILEAAAVPKPLKRRKRHGSRQKVRPRKKST